MVTENDVGSMWWVAWVSEIKSFQLDAAAAADTTFALYIDSHVRYLQLCAKVRNLSRIMCMSDLLSKYLCSSL